MSQIIIFTDGSSRGNPGPGGWGTVISYPDKGTQKVIELGGREDLTTNNRMEIQASIEALSFITKNVDTSDAEIVINTDSNYLINGITKWVFGWMKNGWKTSAKGDVENRDLWEVLARLVSGKKIKWSHVDGHAGVPGNERCDVIATSYADKTDIVLYQNDAQKYPINLSVSTSTSGSSSSGAKKSSSAKAYSYLSLLDGVCVIHKSWAECEARVKGKSGARFKKSISKDDEEQIKKSWGL